VYAVSISSPHWVTCITFRLFSHLGKFILENKHTGEESNYCLALFYSILLWTSQNAAWYEPLSQVKQNSYRVSYRSRDLVEFLLKWELNMHRSYLKAYIYTWTISSIFFSELALPSLKHLINMKVVSQVIRLLIALCLWRSKISM
jgi:hypothetical protein